MDGNAVGADQLAEDLDPPCFQMRVHNLGLDVRKPVFRVCKPQRHRPACTSAQSGQPLCYSLFGKYFIRFPRREKSNFWLVSVAEETGLSLSLSETRRQVFRDEAHFKNAICTVCSLGYIWVIWP